jgi:hypothetical protein
MPQQPRNLSQAVVLLVQVGGKAAPGAIAQVADPGKYRGAAAAYPPDRVVMVGWYWLNLSFTTTV